MSKGFQDKLLIDDLTFKLPPGGIVGVIGPNGAGKTTLFRMITGQEQPDKRHDRRRRERQARLCRPEPRQRSTTRRPSGRKSPAATT
jgi:ATPase subunit of ABC transporter with duplicated ATPase domains